MKSKISRFAGKFLVCAGILVFCTGAFTGGPSVRVSPNIKIEIRWTANFVGEGKVEIFDNPNGGVPIDVKTSSVQGAGHTVDFTVGGVLQADSTYFFRVIHKDPTGVRPDLTNDPAPYPPFFTGVQALTNVRAESITSTGATIAWDANVIGFGSVIYGAVALDQGPVEDSNNTTNHAISLTGLVAGTTYNFEAGNLHAIDLDELATASGQFQTPVEQTDVVLTQPDASPRTINVNEVSAVSVVARRRGDLIPNIVVTFSIDSTSQGNGSFGGASSAQATTDANGRAAVEFTATARGNVFVMAESTSAQNSLIIPVVVRRN